LKRGLNCRFMHTISHYGRPCGAEYSTGVPATDKHLLHK
jgi:hypothetical protein